MSIKQPSFLYIGETKCIQNRVVNQNSGNVSSMTTPLHLRPFAVIAFICGFDGNNIGHRSLERKWQVRMYTLKRGGIIDAKKIAHSASDIVERNNPLHDFISPI